MDNPPSHPKNASILGNILLTVLPALVLFGAGAISTTPYSLLAVMAEPVALALGVTVTALALLERKNLLAGAIAASMVAGGFALHEDAGGIAVAVPAGPTWVRKLKGCAILAKPTRAPVRLVTWTVDGSDGLDEGVKAILGTQPDIVVLIGTDDPEVGSQIQEALGGEVKFVPSQISGATTGMLAVVRGSFQYCGGETDEWYLPMPNAPGSGAMIGFPHVEDIGVVPLIMAHLSPPNGVLDWPNWSRRVVSSLAMTAATAQSIGSRSLVVVGDLQGPPNALALSRPLEAAGLRRAPSGPNWPTQILGMPFWTQHARDQVWTGADWHVQSSRILPSATQSRAPVVVDLIPNQKP
jgi:hypothetical protein